LWVYAESFTNQVAAGESVVDSPNRYVRVDGPSPLALLGGGYAVLYPAMPILTNGTGDNRVQQIVDDAQAAIDALVESGVTARDKCAVGGDSYGATTAVLLLAHSSLFKAGIARSGAYNRTLTPFGFQTEVRNLWEEMEVYLALSPFMAADHIAAPLLLIHGEGDRNVATSPEQSKRMYEALAGLGKTVRLVLLPFEGHAYTARESIMDVAAEMLDWLNTYVK